MKKSRLRSILKIIRNIVIGIVLLFIVLVVIALLYANYEEKMLPIYHDKATSLIQEYRGTKSSAWAQSDEKWPASLKQFLYKYFDDPFPQTRRPMEYIIIKNDYEITTIRKIDDDYLKKVKRAGYLLSLNYYREKYGDNSYNIKGKEFFLGKVENGTVVYFKEPKVYICSYEVCIRKNGLEIMTENMHDDYYILEKDVPLLLKRLNAEK